MSLQYHIKCKKGDIAQYVLLPGDPGRVELAARCWDTAHKVVENRGFLTYTGQYKGVPISCTSTGIGGPSTAIVIEELARIGARVFIRIGTCGTYQDHIGVGDLGIFTGAMRDDGASSYYAPLGYPAISSLRVTNALKQAAELQGVRHHLGITVSVDGHYAKRTIPGSSFNGFWQSSWAEYQNDLKRLNVSFSEMETSTIFVLSQIWGLEAGAIALVLANSFEATGKNGKFDPQKKFLHDPDRIVLMITVASEAVRLMHSAANR